MDETQPVLKEFAILGHVLDEEIDVARAALLIAATEYPDLDVDGQVKLLDSLAGGAARRVGDGQDNLFCLNTLAEYLFDEVGFKGNQEDYYNPENSFLNQVMSRRLGIPITLSLLCSEVGKRVGVPLVGIGMPGHFLVRHRELDNLFVDPFNGGILLSQEECAERFRQINGDDAPWDAGYLAPIARRDFLVRMLRNLKLAYLQLLNGARLEAMAVRQRQRVVSLKPERGDLLDRDHREWLVRHARQLCRRRGRPPVGFH